eukprot:scaffold25749_cov161-Skeletonema_marinoi.AAC.4
MECRFLLVWLLLTYPQIKEGNPADSGVGMDRRTLAHHHFVVVLMKTIVTTTYLKQVPSAEAEVLASALQASGVVGAAWRRVWSSTAMIQCLSCSQVVRLGKVV